MSRIDLSSIPYGFVNLEASLRRGELEPMTDEQRSEMREQMASMLKGATQRRDELNEQIHDLKAQLEALELCKYWLVVDYEGATLATFDTEAEAEEYRARASLDYAADSEPSVRQVFIG